MGPAPLPHNANSDEDVIAQFLAAQGWGHAVVSPMSSDFSARLYRRLRREKDEPRAALLMRMGDAGELNPFIVMQKLLGDAGLRVPAIYAADETSGLALIEDLGDARFDHLLETAGASEKLYPLAVDVLVHLHNASRQPNAKTLNVPLFNEARFMGQAALMLEVYDKILPQGFSESVRAGFAEAFKPALQAACAAPTSLMLRDYHAANILYLAEEMGHKRAAVIDFQDGGVGPITYDLASLLEDARRDVPPEFHRDMIGYYLEQTQMDKEVFRASYSAMAAQRHIRVIAVTARRWQEKKDIAARDYLQRSWKLLHTHRHGTVLAPLFAWLDKNISETHRVVS